MVFGVLALAAAGCRKRHVTPEEQVRLAIAGLERAVEERDVGDAAALISDAYSDGAGNDKQAAAGLLRLQLLRHPSIHLLVRVMSVSLPSPGEARVSALAAVAGLPFVGPAEFAQVSADLIRFDLTLALDKDVKDVWRVRGATWASARAEDFVPLP